MKIALEDGMWINRPAFIVAGGPSVNLHRHLLPKLHEHGLVIATNRSLELPMQIDLWVWLEERIFWFMGDGSFGPEARAAFDNYRGLRVTRKLVSREVRYLPGVIELETDPAGMLGGSFATQVNRGCNVGFFALNIAWLLGANPIILLGYDQRPREDGKIPHWHSDYAHKERQEAEPAFKLMGQEFERAAAEARRKDRSIWNASPDSALLSFPRFESLESIFTAVGGVT